MTQTDTIVNVDHVQELMTTNGCGPLTIVRLRPENRPVDWALMGQVLPRMAAFVVQLGLATPVDTMLKYVQAHWAAGSQSVALWVAIQHGQIVGHALALIEAAWGIPYAMIVQVQIDPGVRISRRAKLEFFAEVEAWATTQGATEMKLLTPHPPAAMTRLTGFTFDKYLMKRKIEEEPC